MLLEYTLDKQLSILIPMYFTLTTRHAALTTRQKGIVFSILCILMLHSPAAIADPREEAMATVAHFTTLITAEPARARHYRLRGDAHYLLNHLDLAIADYSECIRLDDKQDEAYFGRGMALGRRGSIDEGIADLSVFLKRHPNSSLAYTKRGVRYIWKGDFDNAASDLSKAVELDHNNAEAHDDLGVIHAQKGKYSLAATHFLTTIQLDPTYQKAYHNLAMVYYLSGLPQEALDALNAGLALNPENRNSMMLKATILSALNRQKEAQAASDIAEFLPEGNWTERAPVR